MEEKTVAHLPGGGRILAASTGDNNCLQRGLRAISCQPRRGVERISWMAGALFFIRKCRLFAPCSIEGQGKAIAQGPNSGLGCAAPGSFTAKSEVMETFSMLRYGTGRVLLLVGVLLCG